MKLLFLSLLITVSADCRCGKDCLRTEISAQSEKTWHLGEGCRAGARVHHISVEAVDGSGIRVLTREDPLAKKYFAAASAVPETSKDDGVINLLFKQYLAGFTCLSLGSKAKGVGGGRDIFVTIQCTNLWHPCPVLYDIALTCENPNPLEAVMNLWKAVWSNNIKDLAPAIEYKPAGVQSEL